MKILKQLRLLQKYGVQFFVFGYMYGKWDISIYGLLDSEARRIIDAGCPWLSCDCPDCCMERENYKQSKIHIVK